MAKKSPAFRGALIPSLDRMDQAEAKFVLSMRLGSGVIARVHELSDEHKRRPLTEDERRELDFYLGLGSMLTIMHSKARVALKRTPTKSARRKSA